MKKHRIVLGFLLAVLLLPFVVANSLVIPVEGAGPDSWNPEAFRKTSWNSQEFFKGIDLYAPPDTHILAASGGIVLYAGNMAKGGNTIMVLGPLWRVHIYANLSAIGTSYPNIVPQGQPIAAVSDARSERTHLHYSVLTLIPYPWKFDRSADGWKKMFFLDPGEIML
jgi:murein DD-endopeptidase MepM/ murein hydrolase activator NlpD